MSFSNKTAAARDALVSGGDLDAAVAAVEQESVEEAVVEPQDQLEEESAIQSDEQDVQPETDVEETNEEAELPESAESVESDPDVEEIRAGGKKIKIDYKDREKTKRAYKMAAGFRKMQVERDSINSKYEEILPKYEEGLKFEQALEDSLATGGIEGLVSLVLGSEEEFQKWDEARYERRRAKEDASPSELERIEREEAFEKTQLELKRLREERENEKERRQRENEEAEANKLKNLLNPAFNKWRFAGKLGDAALEADIDSMVWSRAKSALNQLPESVELTSKVVEREFRKAANSLRRFTEREANTKVASSIQNKKKEAATKVAMAATKGVESASNEDAMRAEIKKGNFRAALGHFLKNN